MLSIMDTIINPHTSAYLNLFYDEARHDKAFEGLLSTSVKM